MNEILLFGLGLPLITVAIIQMLKAFGLPDSRAPQAALITGIVLSYVAQLVAQFPDLGWWLSPLVLGIVAWAGATGVYHVGKNILGKDHTN
jgi:hypothetical protein